MYTFETSGLFNKNENIYIVKRINDSGFPGHTHKFAELVYIIDGEAVHYIDGTEYKTKKGDLIFINYGQTHEFSGNENYSYYNILYVPEFFSSQLINSENIYDIFRIILADDFEGARQLVSFSGTELSALSGLVFEMEKEYNEKKPGYKSVLNGLSRVLFTMLLRKLGDTAAPADDVMPEILEYVDRNCYGKISLSDLAAKTFYNPSYFSRVFKKTFGTSLKSYVKSKRIDKAKQLLLTENDSVDAIMLRVGYSDKKRFYAHFKELCGVTPSEYRKNGKKSLQ